VIYDVPNSDNCNDLECPWRSFLMSLFPVVDWLEFNATFYTIMAILCLRDHILQYIQNSIYWISGTVSNLVLYITEHDNKYKISRLQHLTTDESTPLNLFKLDFVYIFCKMPVQFCWSDVNWTYHKTYVNLIIPIHMSTNAENLVKIGPVLAEIFSWICPFLQSRPKSYNFPLVIAGVSGPILINFCIECIAKILSFNICELELWYSNLFWYASVLNDGQLANFAQNWLPWQHPLIIGK